MGLHWIKWVNIDTREITAKDAKETTIRELRVFVQNSVLGSIVFPMRMQVFYFAPLASFKVNRR